MMRKRELRVCRIHGEIEFVYTSERKWRCVKCSQEAVQRRREILKQKAIEYKGGKCEICGYVGVSDVYDFHHIDPSTKSFAVSKDGYTRSWDAIRNEVDKCALLCCRCHREVHHYVRLYPQIQFCDISNKLQDVESKEHINISYTRDKKEEYYQKHKRCSKIPTKDVLISTLLKTKSFCGTAREFNVSDNAVRKWCVKYNIPRIKNELDSYLSNMAR